MDLAAPAGCSGTGGIQQSEKLAYDGSDEKTEKEKGKDKKGLRGRLWNPLALCSFTGLYPGFLDDLGLLGGGSRIHRRL